MDSVHTPCSGWYNFIDEQPPKPPMLIIIPFKAGERYLPFQCIFTSAYIASFATATAYNLIFQTSNNTYTMKFVGGGTEDKWLHPYSKDLGFGRDELFRMSPRLQSLIHADGQFLGMSIVPKGMEMGHIDTFKIRYVLVQFGNTVPIIALTKPSYYYRRDELILIWSGSKQYLSTALHKRPAKKVRNSLPAIDSPRSSTSSNTSDDEIGSDTSATPEEQEVL